MRRRLLLQDAKARGEEDEGLGCAHPFPFFRTISLHLLPHSCWDSPMKIVDYQLIQKSNREIHLFIFICFSYLLVRNSNLSRLSNTYSYFISPSPASYFPLSLFLLPYSLDLRHTWTALVIAPGKAIPAPLSVRVCRRCSFSHTSVMMMGEMRYFCCRRLSSLSLSDRLANPFVVR